MTPIPADPTCWTSFNLFLVAIALSLACFVLYRAKFDPLRSVPGPLTCRLTSLYDWYKSYSGYESSWIQSLHEEYGPVVRIAPNEVVIAEGDALGPIYSQKGGFLKSPVYANFDSEGHSTIFSSLNPKHRAVRSKAVSPMFSTGNIRSGSAAIEACISSLVERLRTEATNSRQVAKATGTPAPVDVLDLSRGLAIDSVCSYLFGKHYGGKQERSTKLSASSYVDSVVDFGRFFFLPNWLFTPILKVQLRYFPDAQADESAAEVEAFTTTLVANSSPTAGTYQSRLLQAGISEHETNVQMKDVIFAGTDTTGSNFGTLLWQLAKHPEVYRKLREEVSQAEQEDPFYNPQDLRYLEAVVKEGLRMSLANPTRFPRQVPPTGFTYTSSSTKRTYKLPAGAIVGLQPYTLHFNPEVFPDPWSFKPDRWKNPTPEMLRDYIPFGLGTRQCIARNLAMYEIMLATEAVAKSNVLEGARCVQDKIEMVEWFNARIRGDKIELAWE